MLSMFPPASTPFPAPLSAPSAVLQAPSQADGKQKPRQEGVCLPAFPEFTTESSFHILCRTLSFL